ADDTAVAPGDYTAVTTAGTVTIPAGMTTATISITVIGDETVEANETFFVNLANSTNGTIVDSQGVGTIIDDDGSPVLSINDVTVTEGTGTDSSVAMFKVTLSRPSATSITVNFST